MTGFVLLILAALLAYALIGLYLRIPTVSNRLELPNERSLHTKPVPSGAGVAIIATVAALWSASQGFAFEYGHVLLLTALSGLAVLSWADDRYRLTPGVRLAAHVLAVAAVLGAVAPDQRVLPAVPLVAERVALGLGWLWFINLFNFMDGIDGLAGCEAIAVALGYAVVMAAQHAAAPFGDLAMLVAGACVGYLLWNWHPARVLMGDAGSIPLGFLLGWLLIDLAHHGHWPAAVILPLYFVTDATLTLSKRLLRGEAPWRAHREHAYQRAVLGGATPQAVVWRVNAANLLLIALAVLSVRLPVPALCAAVAVVGALLWELARQAPG
jgi:UDP-N-acetylmuramyl pentapeptide phosphotransferase/UDP-N-acetylglucosamine-1-phosphate transferase